MSADPPEQHNQSALPINGTRPGQMPFRQLTATSQQKDSSCMNRTGFESKRSTGHAGKEAPRGKYLLFLSLAAIGVVYGDIGTSPLYAVRECFSGPHGVGISIGNVLGVLSLIFWTVVVVVTLKYHVYILRADNRGEGGILALMALVHRRVRGRARRVVLALGLFGAALLYADGVLTPAISVLSAVEGLAVGNVALEKFVVPLSVAILIGLFLFQKRGTAGVGAVFGPVIVIWFLIIGILGIRGILLHPNVLVALNPVYAIRFFESNGIAAFLVLGSVFLVATGGEALYADLGHFHERAIQLDWFSLVAPALLLNYFGQGALVLSDPQTATNPFYLLAPSWGRFPLLILATMAAIIASQAIISGSFSLTRQAVLLGYLPRIRILHTSEKEIGQIYVPFVNWALMAGTIAVVIGFENSSNVASAYGVALTATMLITTLLAFVVTRRLWRWPLWLSIVVTGTFLVGDVAFFSSMIVKLFAGGWFPLVVGALILTIMTTWRHGRALLAKKIRNSAVPLEEFFKKMEADPPSRVRGTGVFMTSNPTGTPAALLNNFLHNHTVHERVLLLTVVIEEVPFMEEHERVKVVDLKQGFVRVVAHYGFMESPDVVALLARDDTPTLPIEKTTFFMGNEVVLAEGGSEMSRWRTSLFSFLARNAARPTTFFNIPTGRVMELGSQIPI